MKYVKQLDSFDHLDEMAKSWPVGTIVKCNDIKDCSKSSFRDKWNSWRPSVAEKIQEPGFYMKITESGRSWLAGRIVYTNGFTEYVGTGDLYRFRTTYASTPTSEFKIFTKNEEEIKGFMNKAFFIEGDEAGIMGNDGEKASSSLIPSEYVIRSLNFKLSDLYDEPVFVLFSRSNTTRNFSIKLSDLESLTKELSTDQREVIAEWFSSKLSCIIELQGDRFKILIYKVVASSDDVFKSFTAGPFLNKNQAESFIENLKKEKITTFNPSSLKITTPEHWSSENILLNIDELIKFGKAAGVQTTMKELLKLKRGAVTGKKFGL
jgi:hypothetical protein